jgi:hypothetical protein
MLRGGVEDAIVHVIGVAESEAKVVAVVDGLVKQFGDVVVVEGVNDGPAVSLAGDQPEVAQ